MARSRSRSDALLADPRFDGTILARWREKKLHLRQEEFAARLHYSRPLISAVEANKRVPTLRLLDAIQREFALPDLAAFFRHDDKHRRDRG